MFKAGDISNLNLEYFCFWFYLKKLHVNIKQSVIVRWTIFYIPSIIYQFFHLGYQNYKNSYYIYILMYALTQPLHHGQDMTKNLFVNRVLLVWIQSSFF